MLVSLRVLSRALVEVESLNKAELRFSSIQAYLYLASLQYISSVGAQNAFLAMVIPCSLKRVAWMSTAPIRTAFIFRTLFLSLK